jgi:hypothetical protein
MKNFGMTLALLLWRAVLRCRKASRTTGGTVMPMTMGAIVLKMWEQT